MVKVKFRLYLYGIWWEEAIMPVLDSSICEPNPSLRHLRLAPADRILAAPGDSLGLIRLSRFPPRTGAGEDAPNLLTTDRPGLYKGRQHLNSARLSIDKSEVFSG